MSVYFVALKDVCANNLSIFGGNSDRDPNEANITVYKRAKKFSECNGPYCGILKCGKETKSELCFPETENTQVCILVKPESIWGTEMGSNEDGLTGGVLAVKARLAVPASKLELNAQDMLRLVLERCVNVTEAAAKLIKIIELNGGAPYSCDEAGLSSVFLLADRKGDAVIVETAGKYYCGKRYKGGFACISNSYTLKSNYDFIKADTKETRRAKKIMKNGTSFNWEQCFLDKKWAKMQRAEERRAQIMKALSSHVGNFTADTAREVLRSHSDTLRSSRSQASPDSVCMHAGNGWNKQTTGSMIAVLGGARDIYYMGGASTPCCNIYKPVAFCDNVPLYREEKSAKDSWLRREKMVRYIIAGQISNSEFHRISVSFEKKYALQYDMADEKEQDKLARKAWAASHAIIRSYRKAMDDIPFKFNKGSRAYKKYWKQKTAQLFPKLVYRKNMAY